MLWSTWSAFVATSCLLYLFIMVSTSPVEVGPSGGSQQTNCDDSCGDFYRNCNPTGGLESDKKGEVIDCQQPYFQLRCPMTCNMCKKCSTQQIQQQINDLEDKMATQTDLERLVQLIVHPDYCMTGLRDCANGGTCGNDFKCTCLDNFSGNFCETSPTYHWGNWASPTVQIDTEQEYKKVQTRDCLQNDGSKADASKCANEGGDGEKVVEWYKWQTQSKQWRDAKQSCINLGGSLFGSVDGTSKQLDFLFEKMGLGNGKSIWLGITDEAKQGTWLNLKGEDVGNKLKYKRGEPSKRSGEDYLRYEKGNGATDRPYTYSYPYVCEMPTDAKE